jgi:hypothetical protein
LHRRKMHFVPGVSVIRAWSDHFNPLASEC